MCFRLIIFGDDQSTDAGNLLGSACCLHGAKIIGADDPLESTLATFSDLPVACMEQGLLVLTTLSDDSEKVDVTHAVSLDDFWR